MPHLSKVLARISVEIAAIVIGLPLIEPELSIKSETTVSLNSVSFSFLYDKELSGVVITLASLPLSRIPSSRSNSHHLFCFDKSFLWSLLAKIVIVESNFSVCLSSCFLSFEASSASQSLSALVTLSNFLVYTEYLKWVSMLSLKSLLEDEL